MSDINVISKTQLIVVDVGTGSVSVINAGPQGPAGPTGEATFAYVDAGDALKVSKTGDTMTGDLILEETTPRLDLRDTNGTTDERNYRLTVNTDDVRLIGLSDALTVLYNFLVASSGDGSLDLSGASSVTVPAISGANQAAQVTAYNAAIGQLQIGGREIGDTGWRNVTGSLATGWTADTYNVRRIGSTVFVHIKNLAYSSGGSNTSYTLPSGFRPVVITDFLMSSNSGEQTTPTLRQGAVYLSGTVNFTTTGNRYGIVSFPTDDTWPTSLPGSAA